MKAVTALHSSQEIVFGTSLVVAAHPIGITLLVTFVAPVARSVVSTDVVALLAGNWAVIPLAYESPPTAEVADPVVASATTTM